MDNKLEFFKSRGIDNIYRSIELMQESIKVNELNLNNYVVFTEAATGQFVYTAIIAAMAGAEKVYALTKDSQYGKKEEVQEITNKLAELCDVTPKIEVVFDKTHIDKADIITNLGFLRPISKEDIKRMKETAVIPYMCEGWEIRKGDLDIEFCKERNIKIMGTNEDYQGVNVFRFSGMLAIKMLLDCEIEILGSKIVVVSKDKFGKVIFEELKKLCNEVNIVENLSEDIYEVIKNADALIIADYTSEETYIGKKDSLMKPEKLKELSPNITVVQFAGAVNYYDLLAEKINVYPNYEVGSFRMGKTLAYLGPKPIIDLHCAGLKVGELMVRGEHVNNQLCQSI